MGKMELKDFFEIILKHKVFVILFVLFVVITTSIINFFFLKPVYKGSAILYPAQIGLSGGNTNTLMSTDDFILQVTSENFLQQLAKRLGISYTEVKNLNVVQNKNSKVFKITFESSNKQLIKDFFDKFLILVNDYCSRAYEQQLNTIRNQIKDLSSQVELLKDQANSILNEITRLDSNSTLKSQKYLEYSVLKETYNSILSQESNLNSQITDLNSALNNSNLFYYIGAPAVLERPIEPRKLLNIGISAVSSLFFAIFVALLLEYWKK